MQLMDIKFCPDSVVKHAAILTLCSLHRIRPQHINFVSEQPFLSPPDEHFFWNEDYICIEHEVYVGYSWSWKCYLAQTTHETCCLLLTVRSRHLQR